MIDLLIKEFLLMKNSIKWISFKFIDLYLTILTLKRYQTHDFIENMGSIFFYFIFIILAYSLFPALSLLLFRTEMYFLFHNFIRGTKLQQRLEKNVYWNMILRFLLESYLEICLCSMIGLFQVTIIINILVEI